ncbi:MAG: DUF6472 family protein [Herbinix sp.]|nr:DUF6472 family protein [Herbinix sp.]
MQGNTSCDSCINYIFDEVYDCYECQINLDEDDMGKFLSYAEFACPHFQFDNEYKIVNKQI